MSKFKYVARHDGHEWTRGSDRVYTHAVIRKLNLVQRRNQAVIQTRKSFEDARKYYQSILDGTHEYPAWYMQQSQEWFDKVKAENLVLAKNFFAKNTVELDVAETLAAWGPDKLRMASDGIHFYEGAQWCGRLDLAQKVANRVSSDGEHRIILEAVQS